MTPKLPVYWDERCTLHQPPPGAYSLPPARGLAVNEPHPDQPERVLNIRSLIESELDEYVSFEDVESASETAIRRVHDAEYITRLKESSRAGGERLTPTTVTTPETYDVSRVAAGAAINAAEAAMYGDDSVVPYALVRPSGHHAQSGQADGFCFLNNVAVAAAHALETTSARSVAIIDWDVHHGNGTQEIFYDRDDVLVVSLHNDHGAWNEDYHPQTGKAYEQGRGRGEGYTLNLPLPYGTGDDGYQYAFESIVEPVISQFDPDLLLCSAGQDPSRLDPLGRNVVTRGGFREIGSTARRLARSYAEGNLALIQEGGYQLSTLAFDTVAVLAGCIGHESSEYETRETMWPNPNSELARDRLEQAAEIHRNNWTIP